LYQGDTPPEENEFSLDLQIVSSVRCYYCGEDVEGDVALHEVDDRIYCHDCLNLLFTECDRCEQRFGSEDLTYVNDPYYSSVCSNCYSYLGFGRCDGCDESFRRMTRTVDGYSYCGSCRDLHAHECENCGDWYSEELDNDLCEGCASIPEGTEETE
jgi:hypothetical protein